MAKKETKAQVEVPETSVAPKAELGINDKFTRVFNDDGVARDLSKLPGTIFTFAGGHASRSGTSGVMLNERVDDVLTIAYQGITSPEVKIRALPPDQPQVPTKPVRRHLRRQ